METPDAEQVEKNLSYVKRLAESTAVPVTFGLIPSAAEVWKDKLPDGDVYKRQFQIGRGEFWLRS